MADRFVRVRLVRITGVDLTLFDFDYDLTWVGFFMNAEGKIYGRYGGRDANGPDERTSLKGLRFALQAALEKHRQNPQAKPKLSGKPTDLIEKYPAAKRLNKGTCIHCHQVYEFRRDLAKDTGTWQRNSVWRYPLPENVGLTLDVDQGNTVKKVTDESAAAKLGLLPGDTLEEINGYSVASFADAQFALHQAPSKGTISLVWQRNGKTYRGMLSLEKGWRKTNITWRPSLLDILPALPLYGEDLSAEERKSLNLTGKQLAFRQDDTVHKNAREAGIQPGDIILGVDDKDLNMTMIDLFGYVRQNYLVGDRLTIRLIRGKKKMEIPLTLK